MRPSEYPRGPPAAGPRPALSAYADAAKTIETGLLRRYFGIRALALGLVDGIPRPLLNGAFVFQFGALDQGFWPDGLHAAPSDAALRADLEYQKALGFNAQRHHVKVDSRRFYYHADLLGLLIWQDMPAPASRRVGLSNTTGPRPKRLSRGTIITGRRRPKVVQRRHAGPPTTRRTRRRRISSPKSSAGS